MPDSKTRFSNRVKNYERFRAHYPTQIVEGLKRHEAFPT